MREHEAAKVGGAGLLALVATYGIGRQAYGLFVPTFGEEFGFSLQALGYVASAAQAAYLVGIVATGALAARFGPRVPVVAGCLLLAVGAATVAAAPGPLLLALGLIAAGGSAGGTWAPFSDAVDGQVPPPRRSSALALVNAGSPVGLLLVSVLVVLSGDRWRAAWWAFAAVGLVAAAVCWWVLEPDATSRRRDRAWPGIGWFVHARSARLLVVAFAVAVSSGAYFAYAPDTVQEGGAGGWIGPAMWAVLGAVGAAVGVTGGRIAGRFGLRVPLQLMLALVAGSMALLLVAPGSVPPALLSAGLFGIGFATSFALVVIWSQQVFHDRPTTGFTAVIVCSAAGFIVGPGAFGAIATGFGRTAALLGLAAPALLAVLASPRREDSRSASEPGR
jgi:predicted MFS family arabinose efflux permease